MRAVGGQSNLLQGREGTVLQLLRFDWRATEARRCPPVGIERYGFPRRSSRPGTFATERLLSQSSCGIACNQDE